MEVDIIRLTGELDIATKSNETFSERIEKLDDEKKDMEKEVKRLTEELSTMTEENSNLQQVRKKFFVTNSEIPCVVSTYHTDSVKQ